jgi:transcriptional regulator with XRE-family HTH domain
LPKLAPHNNPRLALDELQYERERIALGDILRTLRRSKKIRGVALAKRTGISQSKLSKIETGALVPSTEDLQNILTALNVPRSNMIELIERARALRTEYVSWRFGHRKGYAASQIDVAEIERLATRIRVFQVSVIPGLLQIPAYSRCVMDLSNVTHQTDLERAVALRIQRQQILYEPGRKFEFLITEPAALSRFCDPVTVTQQLDRLRSLWEMPNVSIGFISGATALPQIPQNSFIIFNTSTVTVETVTGEISTVDQRDIQLYEQIFDAFASIAVFGPEAEPILEAWKHKLTASNGSAALTNRMRN